MLQNAQASRAAEILYRARQDQRRIASLPPECKPTALDDGYRVQEALVGLIADDVFGWKIGSTNKRAQDLVGTTGPIAGRLLGANVHRSPAVLNADLFFMRALEAEFAFTLSSDLPARDRPYSYEHVLAALETLHPAIEISDSRYHDWSSVGAPSLIADNSNDGGFVLGEGVSTWDAASLVTHPVAMRINGETVAEGVGGDVLGDPILSVLWLANQHSRLGHGLSAGQVITTGTCTGVVMAEQGDRAVAEFGRFGDVILEFA